MHFAEFKTDTPWTDTPWCALSDMAARAGVSIEYLCATVEAATQFARDSVEACKGVGDTVFALYDEDEDDLETVVRVLSDNEWEVKLWEESQHPRDERGRFTSGGSAGALAQSASSDASISRTEIIPPSVGSDKYEPPLRVMTAEEARDLVVQKGRQLAAARKRWAAQHNLSEKKLAGARAKLAELEKQDRSNLDEAQRAALEHQMERIGEEVGRHRQIEIAEQRDIAELRKLLYVVDPTTFDVHFAAHPDFADKAVPISSDHHKAAATTGAEEVRRLVSEKLIIQDIYFEEETNPDMRSNHHGDGRIRLKGEAGTRVVVHEFGHDLEARNPRIHDKAVAFLLERTRGEALRRLDEVSPSYQKNEVYKEDRFLERYMGKFYPNMSATEIISMGIEYFHSAPLALAEGDPEYFALIYNCLRGQ